MCNSDSKNLVTDPDIEKIHYARLLRDLGKVNLRLVNFLFISTQFFLTRLLYGPYAENVGGKRDTEVKNELIVVVNSWFKTVTL